MKYHSKKVEIISLIVDFRDFNCYWMFKLIIFQGEIQRTLPLTIFGALAAFGGGVTLLLPETSGISLPQTMQQGEVFSRKSKTAFHAWSVNNTMFVRKLCQFIA